MFLTGFDAKTLNTLYVDKNLKYHGLIQAYSRTNRILGQVKSQGNIISFRNLKKNTDDAVTLFSNKDAQETILILPFEEYLDLFNQYTKDLMLIANTPQAVDELISEDDQLAFVQTFREMLRTLNVLKSFTEFSWDEINFDEQLFEDYKSKYLDIYDRTRQSSGEDVSIIEDLDFELELIQRDEINVSYILNLLKIMLENQEDESDDQFNETKQSIIKLLGQEPRLRSKRELIEQFIESYMPQLKPDENVEDKFNEYWSEQQEQAYEDLCVTENINRIALDDLISKMYFTGKEPLRNDLIDTLNYKPKVLERKTIYERIIEQLKNFIERYDI
jgi:type I restriction enzyme R subunit